MLSADTLVVAEFPDHPAFDHDRALRALFARDHPRRRTRGDASGLLHFGSYGFDRQPHQRSGDFSLRLLVVGNAHRSEDGFIQRRRIASDAPRSIFRIPVFAHRGLSFDPEYLEAMMLHCNMKLVWQSSYAFVDSEAFQLFGVINLDRRASGGERLQRADEIGRGWHREMRQ